MKLCHSCKSKPDIAQEYGIAFEVRHKLLSLSASDARPKEFAPFLMTLCFKKKSSEVFFLPGFALQQLIPVCFYN